MLPIPHTNDLHSPLHCTSCELPALLVNYSSRVSQCNGLLNTCYLNCAIFIHFHSVPLLLLWHEPPLLCTDIQMWREKCRRTDDNHELVVISMFSQMNSCFLVTCTWRCKLYVIPWTFTDHSFPPFQIVGSKIVLLTFLISIPMR